MEELNKHNLWQTIFFILVFCFLIGFNSEAKAGEEVGSDKMAHATLSFAGTMFLTKAYEQVGVAPGASKLLGAITMGTIGYYKELQDKQLDWADMGANGIGIGTSFFLMHAVGF